MYIIPILACAVLVAADQITKRLAVLHLKPLGSVTLLKGVLDLTYVENAGAAFGIMQGARWFFVILTSAALIIFVIHYIRLPKTPLRRWLRLSLILVASGAMGNFIDRLMNGFVVDMLQVTFISFPVFNMADIYITVGAAAFALMTIMDTVSKE